MDMTNGASSTMLPPMGFIAVDVHFTRVAGDAYISKTWPFPLIREKAQGTDLSKLITDSEYPKEFIASFVKAGQKLADQGCVGILTSCGFLAMAQPEVAAQLPIPVATSSLCQLPSIQALLPANRSVGVITFNASKLNIKHITQLKAPAPERVYIVGAPEGGALRALVNDNAPYDHHAIEREIVEAAKNVVKDHPETGAILLECTQLAPFAVAVQSAVKLPVYDVYTLGCWFYSGLVRQRPAAWGPIDNSGEVA